MIKSMMKLNMHRRIEIKLDSLSWQFFVQISNQINETTYSIPIVLSTKRFAMGSLVKHILMKVYVMWLL